MNIRFWAEQRLHGSPMDLLLNLPIGCIGCDKAILVWKGDFDDNGYPKWCSFIEIDSGYIPSPVKVFSEQVSIIPVYIYRQDAEQEIAYQPRLFSFPPMNDRQYQQLPLFWFNDRQIETMEIADYDCDYEWYCTDDRLCLIILEYLAANYQGLPTPDNDETVLEMKWLLENGFCLFELSILSI